MPQFHPQWKQILPLVVVACVIIGSLLYGLSQPVSVTAESTVLVAVKPGMSTQQIGDLLSEQGLIKSALIFRVVAKMEGLANSLQAGEYAFSKAMTVSEIVARLARGETAYTQFTIPEGYTIEQIAKLLESKKLASAAKFKTAAAGYAPYGYMIAPPEVTYKAEGYVFPDTYRVAAGISEEQLLKLMVGQFDDRFTPAMRQQAADLGLSLREAVILASLVEREAQVPQDRPVIAGVFLARLKLGMPLQSCATIQYILGYPKPELTVQDTEIPSPYNTYLNPGLPPGPIANPGMEAIKAVLNPARTDYLYFVADKNGAHRFSRTYEEHLASIDQISQ
ncbi:MAG: endolytic transglycosylase MltG [Negativicutes bacterium]|nr:endolytic transglycosylase MltG [Negativicutes bacterium]